MSQHTANYSSGYLENKQHLKIYYQYWIPQKNHDANILLVHGIGEHSSRYTNLVQVLLDLNIAVFACDLQGHGKSEGQRGYVEHFTQFCSDLELLQTHTLELQNKKPVFILGHSMGGLVSLTYLLKNPNLLAGAIFSSPLFGLNIKVPKWKWALGKLFYKILPKLTLSTGLNAAQLSHDSTVVTSYRKDRLVHKKISSALFFTMMETIEYCKQKISEIQHPVLLLLGENDSLICQKEAIDFFQTFQSKDKTLSTFPGFYHELFNEIKKEKVVNVLTDWLVKHISSTGEILS